jgi:hypothetical protein
MKSRMARRRCQSPHFPALPRAVRTSWEELPRSKHAQGKLQQQAGIVFRRSRRQGKRAVGAKVALPGRASLWGCNSSDWAQRCLLAGISGQFQDRVRPGPVPNSSRARCRTQGLLRRHSARRSQAQPALQNRRCVTGAIPKIWCCLSDKRGRACALLLTCIKSLCCSC